MYQENLLEESVPTVDKITDHFDHFFPLATDARNKTMPVWSVAPQSTEGLYLSAEQIRLKARKLTGMARGRIAAIANSAATTDAPDSRSLLYVAAATKDARLAAQVIQTIDVSQLEPSAIIQTIQLALSAGAHLQARQLAIQGTSLYPDNTELAKMAHILARPVVTRRKSENNGFARKNQLWLKQNYASYKGKWVALKNGELLAVADSMRELRSMLPDVAAVMMTRV